MQDDVMRGKLQIYSVESIGPANATCIVRCVGGIARTGRRFNVNTVAHSSEAIAPLVLEEINRYGRTVDFVDPPHNAKVLLSGKGVSALARGVILVSEDPESDN